MPPTPPREDFRQHLEVETPESVVLDYEVAGIGSRALAAMIDAFLVTLWLIACTFLASILFGILAGDDGAGWVAALVIFANFTAFWAYYTLYEGLRGGQTPGKRLIGIRVVRDTGHPAGFGAASARNLLRIADFLPFGYFLGLLIAAFDTKGRRLGDLVAGTVVVRDRPQEAIGTAPAAESAEAPQLDPGMPVLEEEEFRLLREYQERAPDLDPEVRQRLSGRLATRFADRVPHRPAGDIAFLAQLYQLERERRGSRVAARRLAGPTGAATRFVARQSVRWQEFQRLAERAARDGLDGFAAHELPGFAARYREVAADLARARTYGADPLAIARLERLVAAGHNALYRDERQTGRRMLEVIFRECPAAVVGAWRAVLLATLCFAAPAAAGYLLLRERPALAAELLPDVMLRRAEAGVSRQAEGRGYFEAEGRDRPAIASFIITNNVRVAFACFAGGIFFGVGSLALLAFNGLAIGLGAGHFANRGLLGYLLAFIVGHGVLELFAIWVAGAAGFLLGRALIAPGDLARADALVLNGRQAVRMVGAVVVLLLFAGLIEGFVSASRGGLGMRIGVSVASVVLLALYLLNGARFLRAGGRRIAFDPARSSPA